MGCKNVGDVHDLTTKKMKFQLHTFHFGAPSKIYVKTHVFHEMAILLVVFRPGVTKGVAHDVYMPFWFDVCAGAWVMMVLST